MDGCEEVVVALVVSGGNGPDVFEFVEEPLDGVAPTVDPSAEREGLLSPEALRLRSIPVLGVAFIGHAEPETERIIAQMGDVRILGRLPWLSPLSSALLREAFEAAFDRDHFIRPSAAGADAARR